MKLTKIGHCCLLIEERGIKVLTDPGEMTNYPGDIMDLDLILISHEHQDHIHIETVKQIVKDNPKVKIITNSAVGESLTDAGIEFQVCDTDQILNFGELTIKTMQTKHAVVYSSIIPVPNTTFFIGERLFYPGDSFFKPDQKVEILALPVAGPWMKISEAIEYALQLKPQLAFPVHDGMIYPKFLGSAHKLPEIILKQNGIEFKALLAGDIVDL